MVTADFKPAPHEATRNACRVCAPLGACLAFAGVANCVPYLHGGQGCSTYIRRYTISHFREPLDIASSSFGEATAVFGGRQNLFTGLNNVIRQYRPDLIGIASTCLSETIGEDLPGLLQEFRRQAGTPLPELIFASTPSYVGSHYDGFQQAVYALVAGLTRESPKFHGINLLPNLVSPADIRHLRRICQDFGLEAVILPDYSDTLDGGSWPEYRRLPEGGTPVESIRRMSGAAATIEFNLFGAPEQSVSGYLARTFGVTPHRLRWPVGVTAGDEFLRWLETYSGRAIPDQYLRERGRLLDSYVDAHKYVFGKKALVFGDADFTVNLGAFLAEIGMTPILCAAGTARRLAEQAAPYLGPDSGALIYEGVDFEDISEIARQHSPDMLIGSSKGYSLARRLNIPLVRLGFPVHDRLGAARLACLGYAGTQELFDRVVNSFLEQQQDQSPTGHSYM